MTAPDPDETAAAAVLITGAYGTGKSTVTEDIAELLDAAGVKYGALDLDWLMWFDDGTDGANATGMLLRNVTAVVGNYRAAGVRRFVLAGFLADGGEVEALRRALGMGLATVELVAPLEVIESRLSAVGTPGRLHDLEEARRQVAGGRGTGFAELLVPSDRPVREVSAEILGWLGWLG